MTWYDILQDLRDYLTDIREYPPIPKKSKISSGNHYSAPLPEGTQAERKFRINRARSKGPK